MPKFFDTKFAQAGDKAVIPDELQSDGSVSYAEGFGPDYQKDPLDPDSKPVPRDGMNKLFFDVTDAIADIQLNGVPSWSAEGAASGGYPINSRQRYQSDIWKSLVDSNGEEPGEFSTQWEIDNGGGVGPVGDAAPISIDGPALIFNGSTNTYTITDFDRFVAYTIASTTGTISRNLQTITLVIAAGETAATAQMTITRSSPDGAFGQVTREIAIGAQSIGKPSLLSPSSGATDVSLTPTLVGSAFTAYPTGAATHASTDWRIRTVGGAVAWSSMANTVDKTTITVPAGILSPNTQYFADVRYTGNVLGATDWSDQAQFTTVAISITTPSILLPANGATGIGETPTFTSSVFATAPAGADTHASTNWRVRNSTNTIIWSSLNNTTNKTSIQLPAGLLAVSSNYTVEVQYNGATLPSSPWSAPSGFATAASFAYAKYVSMNGGSSPRRINTYGQDVDTLIQIPAPATQPSVVVNNLAYSRDGDYMAATMSTSPYLMLYKRNGNDLNPLASPAVMPTTACYSVKFSDDGVYLAVAVFGGNNLFIYKRSGDVFTSIGFTGAPPGSPLQALCFGPNSAYLVGATGGSPPAVEYFRTGDVFDNSGFIPDKLPTGSGNINDISIAGLNIVVASSMSPYSFFYYASSINWERWFPAINLDAPALRVCLSDDGVYAAFAFSTAPYMAIYKKTGTNYVKLANPSVLPPAGASCVVFTADGLNLIYGHSSSPYMTVYKRSGDTFTKLANPATLPTAAPTDIVCNPPVRGA